MKEVQSYGLHWEGAVAWLVQGRKGNNFVGLKAQCPFTVSGGMCNHLIPPAAPIPDRVQWQYWEKIQKDPLVRAMVPVPRAPGENLFYVDDGNDSCGLYLTALSRLSSPITPVVKPIWTIKTKQLEKELTSSNVQPLVLTQATTKQQDLVDMLARLSPYSPRTIVVTGASEVVASRPYTRINTSICDFDLNDLIVLPFENIGATLIRRFARKEDLDAPLESRQDKREREIRERTRK